jgi:Citrate synthase
MDTIYRGLAGVNVDTSRICSIDGERGELIYSGYDIRELADQASYEEVAYLLWHGDLPTGTELEAFKDRIRPSFHVPAEVLELLAALPRGTNPMAALRTAVSALGALDEHADDTSDANVRRIGTALLAQVPSIVAAFQRLQSGEEPIAPDPNLSVAGNFLRMLNGVEPSPAATRVMDVALVLHAEHGSNASTFVARSTASSLTHP